MPEQQDDLYPMAGPAHVELGQKTWATVVLSYDGERVVVGVYSAPMDVAFYLTPAEARALGAALIQQTGGEA